VLGTKGVLEVALPLVGDRRGNLGLVVGYRDGAGDVLAEELAHRLNVVLRHHAQLVLKLPLGFSDTHLISSYLFLIFPLC